MKIYVGNLAEQTTEKEIRETFASFGQVSRVAIMTDKESGLPCGFGLVEMKQAGEGELAIAELDGTLLGDRAMKVREARIRAKRNGQPRSRATRN
jgi:RNA recognition motif-containing protein